MADITILTTDAAAQTAEMVCHYATPVANNAVGISWANALVGAGMNTTVLTSGTSAWQISSADLSAIQAGTLRECIVNFSLPQVLASGNTSAALTAIYNAAVAADKTKVQNTLNYFGYTQA